MKTLDIGRAMNVNVMNTAQGHTIAQKKKKKLAASRPFTT